MSSASGPQASGVPHPNLLDLIDELEGLSPPERARRLDDLGLASAERARVEKCLRFADSVEGFLDRPPPPSVDDPDRSTLAPDAGSQEWFGPTHRAGDHLPEIPGYEIKSPLGS